MRVRSEAFSQWSLASFTAALLVSFLPWWSTLYRNRWGGKEASFTGFLGKKKARELVWQTQVPGSFVVLSPGFLFGLAGCVRSCTSERRWMLTCV